MIATDTKPLISITPPPSFNRELEAAWARAAGADPSHPYLARYGLPRLGLRQIGRCLVAPLTGLDGALAGLRLIDERGNEDHFPKSATGMPVVFDHREAECTIVVRGSMADALAVRTSVAARVLLIPPEADAGLLRTQVRLRNPGTPVLIAERSAAHATNATPIGERIKDVVMPLSGLSWAELFSSSGAGAVRSSVDDPVMVFGGVTTPEGLIVRRSGVWVGDGTGNVVFRVSGPVMAIGLAHDEDSTGWQRVLFLVDRDGRERRLFISEQQLVQSPRKVVGQLISAGLEIVGAARGEFLARHLARTEVAQRLIFVSRPGWHGSHYVSASGTIGAPTARLPVMPNCAARSPAASSDELLAWQHTIAGRAESNSRLVAALGVAFGGIAIGLVPEQGCIGVHLVGTSSLGKTTALKVSASVYGPASREVKSWRATDAGLETLAVRHDSRALLLDEIAQIAPDAAAQAAYVLGNGNGRERATSTGRPLPVQTWQITILSSGEITLGEKIAELSRSPTMREGQTVRLIDVPADAGAGHGLFDDLHDHGSGAAMSEALNRAAEASTGVAAQAFAQALAADVARARRLLVSERDRFLNDHLPIDADGIVRRVFANLAMLAAACEVAITAGILPWTIGSGHAGIAICARAWHVTWQKQGAAPYPLLIAQTWLTQNRARLAAWHADADIFGPGHVRDGTGQVYLRPEGWKALCGAVPSTAMRAALSEAGCFRYAPSRLPAGKPEKFYTIDTRVLQVAVRTRGR